MATTIASPPEAGLQDRASAESADFEFTSRQQHLIGDLGSKMRVVGGFFVLTGLLRLFYLLLVERVIRLDLTLLIDVLVGLWTISAGRAFRQIDITRGHDIEYVMAGLGELRKLYVLIFWLLVVAAVVAGAVLLGGLIAGDLAMSVR